MVKPLSFCGPDYEFEGFTLSSCLQLLIITQEVFTLACLKQAMKICSDGRAMQQEQKERVEDTNFCSAGGTFSVCSVCP